MQQDGPQFVEALSSYSSNMLRGLCQQLEMAVKRRVPRQLATAILDELNAPDRLLEQVEELPDGSREALELIACVPHHVWSANSLVQFLKHFGHDATRTIKSFALHGIAALQHPHLELQSPSDIEMALHGAHSLKLMCIFHPRIGLLKKPSYSEFELPTSHSVRGVRVSDGKELMFRAVMVWQLVAESPIRFTSQGVPYKRDWERVRSASAVQSSFFDEIQPIPFPGRLGLAIAMSLGLVVNDKANACLTSTMPDLWDQSGEELHHKVATALINSHEWNELLESDDWGKHPKFSIRRWIVMLYLAAHQDEWISIAQLTKQMQQRDTEWRTVRHQRLSVPMGRAALVENETESEEQGAAQEWVQAFLLGPAYLSNLVQIAQEDETDERVVQLTPLGRAFMGLSEEIQPPPIIEQCLFVQPNHEVIVYRQGVTPELLGQLGSFCDWKSVGAALNLDITSASIHRGLRLGRSGEEIIAILQRHAQHPIPDSVADSIRTWTQRLERLAMYDRCMVLEFRTREEQQSALESGIRGVEITETMLLISDEHDLDLAALKITSPNDFIDSSEPITIHGQGTVIEVNPACTELVARCSLPRFADQTPGPAGHRQRFEVTPRSLRRGFEEGIKSSFVESWFKTYAGGTVPRSVQLMLHGARGPTLEIQEIVTLTVHNESIVDCIRVHPETSSYVLDQIGPRTLQVMKSNVAALTAALRTLGFVVHESKPPEDLMAD